MRGPRFMGANKYHATKINSADGKFDSATEYQRWIYLKTLKAEGTIKNLVRQVPYTLIPTLYKDGKVLYRECKYLSDFEYDVTKTGEHIVEDVKGIVLPIFRLKQKLMYHVFGVEVRVVKNRGGKWIVV